VNSVTKNIISIIVIGFLLSSCFSSRDLEYDYDSQEEIVIIEYVPIPSPPPIVICPVEPIVEQPKRKRRTNYNMSRRPVQKRVRTSYQSRNLHKRSVSRNNSERSSVEKRTRKRR